jgi:hypothetical protein
VAKAPGCGCGGSGATACLRLRDLVPMAWQALHLLLPLSAFIRVHPRLNILACGSTRTQAWAASQPVKKFQPRMNAAQPLAATKPERRPASPYRCGIAHPLREAPLSCLLCDLGACPRALDPGVLCDLCVNTSLYRIITRPAVRTHALLPTTNRSCAAGRAALTQRSQRTPGSSARGPAPRSQRSNTVNQNSSLPASWRKFAAGRGDLEG